MINEDYVSFETAKLLKEKGFPQSTSVCNTVYKPNGYISNNAKSFIAPNYIYKDVYVFAPTLQMAMKWLREVHGLHISLEPCYDYDSMHVVFLAFVQNVADVHEFMDGRKNVASYPNAEKSCELAIKYCLENLPTPPANKQFIKL